jgi:hypothetical protein
MIFDCPKCHQSVQEDELHTCGGKSFYAPGIVRLLKKIAGEPVDVQAAPVEAPPKYETPTPRSARREKR